MSRRSLGILAIILIVLMAVVVTAGLDGLPRQVRQAVTASSAKLETDRTQFQQNRQFVEKAISDEPALFRTKVAGWREMLQQDQGRLDSAAAQKSTLDQLVQQNRRADRDKVTSGLAQLDSLRMASVQDASGIRVEAERWLSYKRDLPSRQNAMRASYEALHAFDVSAATEAVQKAILDWPAKKDDLSRRLEQLKTIQAQGEQVWQSTSSLLPMAAEATTPADFDYATFFQRADALDQAGRGLKDGAATLTALSAQLYANWDKLLVDLDEDNGLARRSASSAPCLRMRRSAAGRRRARRNGRTSTLLV